MAMLTSDKINFKSKIVSRHKEEHYILMKGSMNQEDITVINFIHTYQQNPKIYEGMGLPWQSTGKTSRFQCRGHGFDLWSGN